MKPCALVLVCQGEKVLLVKRKDVPVWVLPGGGIDPGEEPIEAARRELLEESGLTARALIWKGHFIPINSLTQETYLFLVEEVDGQLEVTDETADVRYFDLDKLPKGMFPLHEQWMRKSLESEGCLKEEIREVTWQAFLAYAIRHPWIVLRFLWTVITKP